MLVSVPIPIFGNDCREEDRVNHDLFDPRFFLSANRGSFKMLVRKEVTAGFAFRIFEGRMITRGVGDRFSMAEDPAREQWTLR